MKISLVYHLYALNGAYTSFVDLYYNLKKFTNHDIMMYVFYDDRKHYNQCKKYLAKDNKVIYLPTEHKNNIYNLTADKFIYSTEVIRFILDKKINLSNVYDNILFYPAFVYREQGNDIDRQYLPLMEYINNTNMYIVCNKFNSQYITDKHKCFIWYMKFSHERIDMLKKYCINNGLTLTSEDYYIKKGKFTDIKPFEYSNYEYFRYAKKTDKNNYTDDKANYYENIGKLMFEFLLLDKQSYYYSKNKHIDDGLTEMLEQFGIDDNYDFNLNNLPSEQLNDILFMKSDDKLLQLINKE